MAMPMCKLFSDVIYVLEHLNTTKVIQYDISYVQRREESAWFG